jgi:hypothetical protein
MKCPHCGVLGPAGAAECPACGVIFAKFKKKLETGLVPASVPSVFNPWKGRAIAAALVALEVVGFGLYYRPKVSVLRVWAPHGTMSRPR